MKSNENTEVSRKFRAGKKPAIRESSYIHLNSILKYSQSYYYEQGWENSAIGNNI